MRFLLSLFQTAEGGPHWISILTFAGWLVTGGFILTSLVVNRNDRVVQGPWILTPRQESKFIEGLKTAVKGKVALEYSNSDTKRVRGFALKLEELLKQSGYDVWGYVASYIQSSGEPINGIRVEIVKSQSSDSVGAGIQKAFVAAGIEAPGVERQNQNYQPDTALIRVGNKP
jgi:hypothetical protein